MLYDVTLGQGLCVNGLINVAITSIEKRFGLKSAHSGMIASSYDIGSMLAMIPVSYLGGRRGASKPKWIGAGLICMGLGSLSIIIFVNHLFINYYDFQFT